MADVFDEIELEPAEVRQAYDRNPKKDAFDEVELEESWGKSLVRSLAQIPKGIARAKTWPLDVINLIGTMDAFDPEEVDRIRNISEREGIPFDEQKYYQAAEAARDYFPTVGNAARLIEEKTGAPLEAKTRGQKFIEFASAAGKGAQQAAKSAPTGQMGLRGINAGLPAPVVGTGVAVGKEALVEGGLPEPLAELGSLALMKQPPKGSASLKVGKKVKPSGMTERRYEDIKTPVEVTPTQKAKINNAVEEDFRKIKDEIIKDSPIEKTYNSLKEDKAFKGKIGDLFEKVEEVAESNPERYSSAELRTKFRDKAIAKQTEGTTLNEYDKNYKKFMNQIARDTPLKEISNAQLIKQYRKNNKDFADYNPSRTKAWNRARKDALLDSNDVISSMIKEKNPDSELGKLFDFTNKRWKEIHQSEMIDKFTDDLFKGQINFKKGEKFANKDFKVEFKKALGDQYPKFETLMEDLMGTERANGLLKAAKDKGYKNLVRKAGLYLFNPKIAAASYGVDAVKQTYKTLLDKPKLSVTWDNGIKSMKRGDFSAAEKAFDILDKEL